MYRIILIRILLGYNFRMEDCTLRLGILSRAETNQQRRQVTTSS
jgi:hypothetical protein